MKPRHLTAFLLALVFSSGSAFAQMIPVPDTRQVLPAGIHYMNLKTDGLPATADKAALAAKAKARKSLNSQLSALNSDYPYPVQMYDYLDYAWTPDTVTESYDEDDEVLWNLPKFDFYNFHKPTYGMGCGAFIENGKLHTFVSDFLYGFMGQYSFDMVTYNAETMQVISRKNFGTTSADQDYLCLAQCQYPLDEKKGIGIFYNTQTAGEDWAIMDFENETIERVHTCDKNYGIIVTDGTSLYGWCEDNCIYKIDPQTFKSTKVGAHGFSQYVMQSSGAMGAYVQSATYDKNTKTCYWGAFSAKTGESGFFKVDLSNAKIEKVLDTYVTQHLGICTNPETVSDDAPGPVTDLALTFEGANHSGTASFTMPTKNYKGDRDLEGTMSYRITQGTTTLASSDGLKPGETVNVSISLKKDGNYVFNLQTSLNGNDWSKATKVRKYVGYDTPKVPASAILSIARDGTANVHWTAPTEGTHSGYLGNLAYDVYRIHGKEMKCVALALTDTTFIEQLSVGAVTTYSYAIIADDNGHQSDFCYSNSAACGKPYECPMIVEFSGEDVFNMFEVCDANKDGCTWSWDNDRDYLGYAKCKNYNSELSADDWLFSPGVSLKADRKYTLSYTAGCVSMSLPERISVGLGKEKTPEAMTQMIEKRYDVPSGKHVREVSFTVTEDGDYYLGFQSCSDVNELTLMLYGFRLDVEPLADAPAAVENFSCTAGDKGATDATLRFNAPTQTAGGAALTNISKITIERDNNVVKTWENVTPGEALEFYDNVGSEEYHQWVVYTYNLDADANLIRGDYKEQRLYLGLDVPAPPQGGYIIDNKTSLDVCWEPVTTGAHGGYVDPDDIQYEVRNYYHQVQGYTKDTHMVINCNDQDKTLMIDNTDDCDLSVHYYRLASYNSKGTAHNISDFGTTSDTEYMLRGKISGLPFVEHVKGASKGVSDQSWWQWSGDNDTNYTMGIGTGTSSDGDNGCFGWECFLAGDNFHLRTTKLDFTNVRKPQLSFGIASEVHDFTIAVNAITPGHNVINICNVDMADVPTGYWGTVTADIPMEVANDRYAVIEWHFTGTKSKTMIFFDNINISDSGSTAIGEVENQESSSLNHGAYYNIQGARVDRNYRGIVIRNGHKMLK